MLYGKSKLKRLEKWVLRIVLVILALILASGGYLWWFISGEPVIEVDYIAKLNAISRPVGLTEQNNGWPDISFAIEGFSESDDDLARLILRTGIYDDFSPRFCELSPEGQHQVEQWIQQHEEDWDLLTAEEKDLVTKLLDYRIVPVCLFKPPYEIYYSKDRSYCTASEKHVFNVRGFSDIDESDLLTLRIPPCKLIAFERLNNAMTYVLDYVKSSEQIGSLSPDLTDTYELVDRFAPRNEEDT